jgi:hypothetical protein
MVRILRLSVLTLVFGAGFCALLGCADASPSSEEPLVKQPVSDAAPGVPRVPFAVDDFFYPSGCMGDCAPPIHAVLTAVGECRSRRLRFAQGNCYRFTYAAPPAGTPGVKGWAGVLWQHPSDNWGGEPGQDVAPGATQVSFYAAGASGGEVLRFQIGGIKDPTLKYADAFEAELTVTLTSDYERYTIPLKEPYQQVLGGFGWVVTDMPPGQTLTFELDDIRWE